MRLIDTRTLELRNFITRERPDYVILSHRWQEQESTLQEYREFLSLYFEAKARRPSDLSEQLGDDEELLCALQPAPGIRKVLEFRREALRQGYKWAWVDTVCTCLWICRSVTLQADY